MANETEIVDELQGATAVITHRIRSGHEAEYDLWLQLIGPACKAAKGHLDLQIIRPIAGLTATYTIVIRFDTPEHLHAWMTSDTRNLLINKVRHLLAKDDDFFIRTGLDFWFTPEGAKAKVPVRWKQFLLTWSAIYPLVLGMTLLTEALLGELHVPQERFSETLFITGIVVFLMVYIVMPRYTKVVHRWLFN